MVEKHRRPSKQKFSDEQVSKLWNEGRNLSEIGSILGVGRTSVRDRIDRLFGEEARRARSKTVKPGPKPRGNRPDNEETHTLEPDPRHTSNDHHFNKTIITRKRADGQSQVLKRWFGEPDDHFEARKQKFLGNQPDENSPIEVQRRLRQQSRIASNILGDP